MSWEQDESPLTPGWEVCEGGCWCYMHFAKHAVCFCKCHGAEVEKNIAARRRARWNGTERPRG